MPSELTFSWKGPFKQLQIGRGIERRQRVVKKIFIYSNTHSLHRGACLT